MRDNAIALSKRCFSDSLIVAADIRVSVAELPHNARKMLRNCLFEKWRLLMSIAVRVRALSSDIGTSVGPARNACVMMPRRVLIDKERNLEERATTVRSIIA